jgi:hypothetical protein
MGGLEYDTTYDINANHSDYTFVAADLGKIFGVDLSGAALTSEVIFDLPAEANVNVGERIGFYITNGSSTDGEELAIRTAAVGDTINGTDYNASDWSRLFITGELVIFRCINKTTQADWIVEYDGRIPCVARLTGGSDITSSGLSTFYDVPLNSSVNVGNVYDSGNGRIKARRTSKWQINGITHSYNNIANEKYYSCRALVNTTVVGYSVGSTGYSIIQAPSVAGINNVNDGDYIKLQFSSNTTNAGADVSSCFLSGMEIL